MCFVLSAAHSERTEEGEPANVFFIARPGKIFENNCFHSFALLMMQRYGGDYSFEIPQI